MAEDHGPLLEANEEELRLEDNEEDGPLLEENDEDGPLLEENDEDDLCLEDNEEDELVLEENDGGGPCPGESEEDELLLEENDDVDLRVEYDEETELLLGQNGGVGSAGAEVDQARVDAGLQQVLKDLGAVPRGTAGPEDFLTPEAKARLEAALASNGALSVSGESDRLAMTLQQMTAHEPEEVFLEGARKIRAKMGAQHLAQRMRLSGDDHFAAGAYAAARHAYTAGITYGLESEAAEMVHLHINRAAAHLKEGNPSGSIEDCDRALALADAAGLELPASRRKAMLRRAAAYIEQCDADAASRDLRTLPSGDRMRRELEARMHARIEVSARQLERVELEELRSP